MNTQVQVKERPILMHARSIRGILEGRKTQTRRIVKHWAQASVGGVFDSRTGKDLVCPYGQPGDRLWVRETLRVVVDGIEYAADDTLLYEIAKPLDAVDLDSNVDPDLACELWNHYAHEDGPDLHPTHIPSIYMPLWASRLTLEITDIRVERVQDISVSDCFAEGIERPDNYPSPGLAPTQRHGIKQYFAELWDDTNGKGAWKRNDWVWVLSFRQLKGHTPSWR